MKRDHEWALVFPKRRVPELRQEVHTYIASYAWSGKEPLAWGKQVAFGGPFQVEYDNWVAERSRQALLALGDCVEIHPQKLGGVPVIRGTRFSISQLLGELGDNNSVSIIAENYEVDEQVLKNFLHALAVYINRPLSG